MSNTKSKPAARASRKRSPKKTKVPPIKAAEKPNPLATAEVPGWVNETPDEDEYRLVMFDGGGSSEQEVGLTRNEFITAKRCVAALRGYALESLGDHTAISEDRLEIGQEEMQMVMDLEQAMDVLILNFKSRLAQGAKVESGKWRLTDDGSDCKNYYRTSLAGLDRCGLEILDTKETMERTTGSTDAA